MRNKTIELSVSDETPRGGAGGLRDLVIGRNIPLRPQNLNSVEEGVCIENNPSFWESIKYMFEI